MPVIQYSQNEQYYYIIDGDNHPAVWMSTEETPGEVPEALRKDGGIFSPIYAQFKLTDGRVYYRKVLPFTFWKVQSNGSAKISSTHDRYLDYATYHHNSYGGKWKIYPEQLELFDETKL